MIWQENLSQPRIKVPVAAKDEQIAKTKALAGFEGRGWVFDPVYATAVNDDAREIRTNQRLPIAQRNWLKVTVGEVLNFIIVLADTVPLERSGLPIVFQFELLF